MTWGSGTETTGLTETIYDDSTVVADKWYRYRVAGADTGEPTTDFTNWVQQKAVEPPPVIATQGFKVRVGGSFVVPKVRIGGQWIAPGGDG